MLARYEGNVLVLGKGEVVYDCIGSLFLFVVIEMIALDGGVMRTFTYFAINRGLPYKAGIKKACEQAKDRDVFHL
ncbi:hypothetical protein ACFL53_02045 [Pseudomonadota bacterium]